MKARQSRLWAVRVLVLALLSALLPAAVPAQAIPPGGAGPNTPGTWSRVSPRSLAAGGLIHFTVGGFPKGETVYVKIDDGKLCSDTSHGACVYHTQKIPNSGVVNGSFRLPANLSKGSHTLRFLASAYVDADNPGAGTKGYTNRSPRFTVKAGSRSSGASSTTTTGTSSSSSTTGTSSGSTGVLNPTAQAQANEPATAPDAPAADGSELSTAKAATVSAHLAEGRVVLTVGADYAGEWAFVYAFSQPTPLGWQQVAVDGTVTVATDALAPGEHRLTVQDVDAGLLGWAQINLTGASPPASTPSATAAPAPAPEPSGVGIGVWALAAATTVVGAGLVIVLLRRRAATRAASSD
ncbi:hypothetical protein [Micropruina sp.]|uniref:hypothetical protein n=1 Tax=Micropruina sp. TaxID=2737536 RepID=UPI0039E3AE86